MPAQHATGALLRTPYRNFGGADQVETLTGPASLDLRRDGMCAIAQGQFTIRHVPVAVALRLVEDTEVDGNAEAADEVEGELAGADVDTGADSAGRASRLTTVVQASVAVRAQGTLFACSTCCSPQRSQASMPFCWATESPFSQASPTADYQPARPGQRCGIPIRRRPDRLRPER